MEEKVTIEFTKDEALVLFEFISRINEQELLIPLFEDQAEQRATWNLECLFQKELVEPFDHRYKEIIQEARNRLRDTKD